MFELFTSEFWSEYGRLLLEGCGDTILMTLCSTVFAYLLGLPLGVLLVLTGDHGILRTRQAGSLMSNAIHLALKAAEASR